MPSGEVVEWSIGGVGGGPSYLMNVGRTLEWPTCTADWLDERTQFVPICRFHLPGQSRHVLPFTTATLFSNFFVCLFCLLWLSLCSLLCLVSSKGTSETPQRSPPRFLQGDWRGESGLFIAITVVIDRLFVFYTLCWHCFVVVWKKCFSLFIWRSLR